MSVVYVLMSGEGEHSDRHEDPVAVYTDEARALAASDALNDIACKRNAALHAEMDSLRSANVGSLYASIDRRRAVSAPFYEEARALGFDLRDDYCVVEVEMKG